MKRIFSALRGRFSKVILGISLVIASIFVAIQVAAVDTGSDSVVDNYLLLNQGGTTNQQAQHPDTGFLLGQTNVTAEAWIYPTKVSGRNAIFSKEFNLHFGIDSGRLWTAFYNGSWYDNVYTDTTVQLNTWQHVAYVKLGTTMKIFLNGVEVVSRANAAPATLTSESNAFLIGNRSNGEYFSGRIDEARVWQVDRSSSIASNMHTRVAGTSSGLVGYWDFNEPSGTTVYDRTIGSWVKNLTLVNSPTRRDVKEINSLANGETVVKFPRTYLPGVGGWTAPSNAKNMKSLVVAGGGGGGGSGDGGGGGAGGVVEHSSISLSGVTTVQVGQGGVGGRNEASVLNHGTSGQDSLMNSVRALGGGGGGGYGWPSDIDRARGYNGGSGGGHAEYGDSIASSTSTQTTDSTTYANATEYGNSGGSITAATQAGSGGGGAGGAGTNTNSWRVGGAGGTAMTSSITGTSTAYAAGGGGADRDGAGALGGSGIGGQGGGTNAPTPGNSNTGSGGGGANGGVGGSGGAGIVIIRYTQSIDNAWTKVGTAGYYASATSEIIPVATNAEWTVEAWVNPQTLTAATWYGILGQANAGSNRYSIWSYGQASLHVSTPDTNVTISYKLETNRWTHIAWAMGTGTTSTLYIDGQQIWQGTMARTVNAGSVFTVGGTEQETNNEFDGSIDQVKVWSSALTAAQVQTSMHAYSTFTGSPTLRAHYDFNEVDNGVLFDRSGNNRNLSFPSSFNSNELSTTPILETGTAHSTQTYYKFKRSYLTANGGWVSPNLTKAKALVVAGGGGGGGGPYAGGYNDHMNGGGGGAGGLKENPSLTMTAGATYPIKVGAGGFGTIQGPVDANTAAAPNKGQSSELGSLIVATGGGGGGYMSATGTVIAATTGGSGGGGGAQAGAYPTAGAAGTAGEGNTGGNGFTWNGSFQGAGGGGGAGGAGVAANSTTRTSGAGGPGLAYSITGSSVTYAGGGGGGSRSDTAGAGGAGGGGAGGRADVGANGAANLGGGGGGGTRSAGAGGSGVVILSYGPVLEVTQLPTSSRAGSAFTRPVKVTLRQQDGTTAFTDSETSVTVSAASGVLQLNGISITSTSVTTVNGVATFTGLGFQSGISTAQTLTFTSDAFVGATQSITPTFMPSSITINSGVTTGGTFTNGIFEASSSGTVNILNSDLVTALSTGNVTIDTSGSITISAAVQSSTSSSLTLKAGTDILQGAVTVSTAGGAITYWSDTDSATTRGGGIQTARGSSIATNGGALTMSGGTVLAEGYAKGTSNTNQRGLNLQGAITTGAGNVIIRGEDGAAEASNVNTNWGAGVMFTDDSSLTTTSGTISITGVTTTDTPGTVHRHSGVIIGMLYFTGVSQSTYADASIKSDSGNITINGSSSSTVANRDGVIFFQGEVASTDGNILITATTANTAGYDFNFGNAATGNRISSTNGSVTLNGGTNAATSAFSGSTITAGGALTLNVNKPTFATMNLNGAGAKVIQHPTTATNFGAAVDITGVSFANTSTSLTVGRSGITPTQTVTLGSANTSIAGNVTVYGAAITQSGAVQTTSGGNVTYSGAGAYSQSGALTSAGTITQTGGTSVSVTAATSAVGTISYTGSGAVSNSAAGTITSTGSSVSLSSTASTMALAGSVTAKTSLTISQTGTYTGAGVLTAQGGTLSISGGTSVALSGAVDATGNITIAGSTEITNPTSGTIDSDASISITSSTTSINLSKAVTAATNLTLRANTSITTSAAVKATAGAIAMTATTTSISLGAAVDAGTSITITPKTTYDGAGALTAGTTLSISGGSNISPTGNLQAGGNITLSGSGQIYLSLVTVDSDAGSISMTAGSYGGHAIQLIGATITAADQPITLSGTSTSGEGIYAYGSGATPTTISTTSGAISLTGVGTDWGIWFGAVNVLSTSGAISLNSGAFGIATGVNATTNFGALAAGTSQSTITVTADRYWNTNTATKYKTSGAVLIQSAATQFSEAITMSNTTFTGNASLTIGKVANTRAMTIGGTVDIVGDYLLTGGAITQNAPVTTSSPTGDITFNGAGAFSNSGALNAGGGLYITGATTLGSTAAWTTNSALDVEASGAISTGSLSPITVNTGYLKLNSTAGSVTIGETTSAPGNVTLIGDSVSTTASLKSTTGLVSITADTSTVSIGGAVQAATSISITPKTTYVGAGALTAGTTLAISGGTSVAPTGAIQAGGAVIISGSAAITNATGASITSSGSSVAITSTGTTISLTKGVTASTSVTLLANTTLDTSAAAPITATTGAFSATSTTSSVTIGGTTVAGTSITIAPKSTYDGAGSLTASAGTLSITGGSSVAPTGAIQASGAITISGTAAITNATGATITSTGASVSITSTGTTVNLSKAISAATSVTLLANTALDTSTAAPITATAGAFSATSTTSSVTIGGTTAAGTSITISPKTTYDGAGSLTAANGALSITGGSTVAPTGAIQATGDITFSGTGNISTATNATVTTTAGLFSVNSTAGTVIIGRAVSTVGPITMLGNTITANANLITSGSGQNILLKSKGSILLADNITVQTAGGSTATIVFWTSSAGTAGGYMSINNRVCINTQGSCSSPLETGGADIFIGGGIAGTTYPTGPVTGGGNSSVQLGGASSGAKKIYSAGGKISMKGQSTGGFGMIIDSGTDIDSGNGAIELSGQTSGEAGWGIYYCQSHTSGACNITSSKDSGTAISVTGTATGGPGQGWSPGIGSYSGGAISSTIKADGGGDLVVSGTSTYHWDMIISSMNFYASTGDIYFNAANKGVLFAYQNNQVFGGATSAASSADVIITTDVYYDDSAYTNTFNTTGKVTIKPFNNSFDSGSNYNKIDLSTTFNGVTGLTFGKSTNTTAVVWDMMPSIAGPIKIYAGDVTVNKGMASTAGTEGIFIKSAGAIATSGTNGTTGLNKITTTGGPITLWAGHDGSGSISVGKWTTLDSNSASTTGGGDITLGGNSTAATGNAEKPAGPVVVASGDAINLGSDSTQDAVQILGDGGKVYIGGKTTHTATTSSGIEFTPGLKISAGEVEIYGETASTGDNTAAGLFSTATAAGTFATSGITATDAFADVTDAISITNKSAGTYGGLYGNFSQMTISATGAKGGIKIAGSTSKADSYGVWLGKTIVKTTSGNISIDSGDDKALIGRDSDRPTTLGDANTSGLITISSALPEFTNASISTSSQVFVEPVAAASFAGAVTFPSATTTLSGNETGLTVGGDQGNTAAVTVGKAVSIAGPIAYRAGTLTVSFALNSASGTQSVNLKADQMTISAAVSAGLVNGTGSVQLTTATTGKTVALGSADSLTQLGLTDAELDNITTKTLRIGDYLGTSSGNVTVTGAISIAPEKVGATAIRTTGSVTGTGTIAATNLGIAAASINLGTTSSVSGSLAIATGSAPTFSSSANYTPNEVDGIAADFGTATQIILTDVPTNATQDAFMAVVFNPPPVVTIKDKFNLALQSTNTASATTVTAARASGSGTLGGTLTETPSAGVATFDDLKISGTGGEHTITFTYGTLTATTGTYDVKGGEPAAISVSMAQTTIAAGKSFDADKLPVVTIKDAGGNTLISGPHRNSTITATIIGTDGEVLAGDTEVASNGVATFDGLSLAGKVGGTYSLRFSVTYVAADSSTNVVNSPDKSITFTAGDATQLVITQAAAGAANRAVFTTQPIITLKDAYGNVVIGSSTTITVSEASSDIALAGTTSMPAASGVANFSLNTTKTQLNGKAATGYTLTYTSTNPSLTATQNIDLTFGAATKVVKTTSAAGFTNAVAFTTQPVLKIQDQDGNTVTNSTAKVTVSSSGATLSGTVEMDAVAGIADFAGKGIKLTGTKDSYTLTYASANLTSDTQAITLLPGAAHHLALITAGSGARSDQIFDVQPIIEVQDVSNNAVPNSPLVVGISGYGIRGNSSYVNASTGRTAFNNIKMIGTASVSGYTLTFSTTDGVLSTTQVMPLAAGAAAKLILNQSSINAVNGVDFPATTIVTVADAQDNPVLNSTATVSIAGSPAGASTTNMGSRTLSSGNGTVSFANMRLTGVAQTYNLRYSSGSLTVADQTVVLSPGAAHHLTQTTNAAGFANRALFSTQPVVEIRDISDNVVTSSSAAVTVAMTNGTLTGTTTVNAASGIATFTDLYKYGSVSTTKVLSFTSPDITGASQSAFTLTPGVATQLVATTEAAGFTNGAAFTTQPVLKVQDQDGNTVTSSSATVTVTSTGTATLGGTTSMNAVSGVADFASKGLKLTGDKGANTLTYAITDPGSFRDSQSVNLLAGLPTQLVLTTAATNFVNREDFDVQPVVEIRDASGNVVSGSNLVVTAAINSGTLTGSVTATAVDGVATFTGLGKYGTIGSKRLTFSSGLLTAATQDFVLTYGAPSQLAVTTASVGFRSAMEFATQPVVKIQDADGNTVTNSSANVTVTQSAGTLSGTYSIDAVSGIATFTNLKLRGTAGNSYNLTYASSGVSSDTESFTLLAGEAHHLAIIAAPTSAQNRASFTTQPVIEVQDISNNPVPDSGLSIIASTSAMTLDGTKVIAVNASTGQAVFSGLSLRGLIPANQDPELSFAANGLTTLTQAVSVTPGAANKLQVTPTNYTAINATQFDVAPTLAIQDIDGNRITNSSLTVSVAVTPATGSTSATSTAGFASQTFTSTGQLTYPSAKITGKAQTYNVTYSANGISSAVQEVILGHSAATQLVKVAMPTSARAGIGFSTNPKFEIQDISGNTVTTGNFATSSVSATVAQNAGNRESTALRTAGSITSAVTAQAVNGVVEFTDINLIGDAGDTYDISFTIATPTNAIAASTQQVSLTAGDPYRLKINQQPANVAAGSTFTLAPTVQITDEWNNPVGSVSSSYAIKANLVDTANSTIEDSSQTAVTVSGSNDTATFSAITFSDVGNYKLRFTSTGLVNAVSDQFAISSAPAHHLVWANEGSTTVKNGYVVATAPKLKIVDQFENPVTTGSLTTVTVTATGTNANNVISIPGDTLTNTAGSEFIEFTNLKLNAKVGSYKLRFTATNSGKPIHNTYKDLTNTLAITHGDATKVALATSASGARAGIAFSTQPVVEVRDANDNVVTDSTLEISATITDAGYGTIGTTAVTAVSGVANFASTGFGITGSAATGRTLNFSTVLSPGVAANVTQQINLTAGAAAVLVMSQQPSTVQTGDDMSPAPSVILRDAWQNPVLSDSSTRVRIQLYRSANLAGTQVIAGQTAISTASSGTATFNNLEVIAPSKAGYSYKFTLLDGNDSPVGTEIESEAFEITPGAPTSIEILTQPNSYNGLTRTKSGELLKIQPAVRLRDASNNITTQIDSGTVSISVVGTGGSLSGQITANIVDGVATFTGVKLHGKSARDTTAATGYTFTFNYLAISEDSDAAEPSTVDHNVAHHLTQVRNAGTARAGYFLTGTSTPKIEVRDADDNLVNTGVGASSTILTQALITSTNASATVTGMNQTSAVDGVAELYVGIGGLTTNSYTYTFSVLNTPSITSVSQSGVSVTYGSAAQLVVTTQPGSLDVSSALTKTGSALAVQPVIELRDTYGNRVDNAGSDYRVDASILGAVFDARDRLTGATATATNGVVTFTELALVGRPGHDYTLGFKWYNTNTQVAATQTVAVTHAEAHHLTITQQAASELTPGVKTKTGDRLAVQPIIEVRDFDDNVVTTNSAYSSVRITAAVSVGGGSTTATDGNTTNVATAEIVNGIAEFADLKVVATPNTAQTLVYSAPLGSSSSTLSTLDSDATPFELTHASAAKLAVANQPCTGNLNQSNVCQPGQTAAVMGVQPTIQVQDRFGNPVPDFIGTITVAATNSGSLAPSTGALSINLNGASDATFSGLALEATPGTNYRLAFMGVTAGNVALTSVQSGQIQVTNAAATQIRVTTQPVGAKTGSALSAQPSVEILDRFGNRATTDSSKQITVTATGGSLSGTTTVTVTEGVADFTDLAFVGTPGTDYELIFRGSGLSSELSSSFRVTHADANRMLWIDQPDSAIKTGDRVTPQLKLVDFKGNTATTANPSSISASVTGSNGTLVNTTGSITAGIITFSNLKLVGDPGTTYTIAVTAVIGNGSITSLASSEILLSHAVPAKLVVDDSAVGGLSGSTNPLDPALTQVPKLNILDRFDNPATTDSSTQVSISIASGSGGTLSGTTTVTAVNGVATFTGLVFAGTPGTQYTFTYSAVAGNSDTFGITDSSALTVEKRSDVSLGYTNQSYVANGLVAANFTTDNTGVYTKTYTITNANAINTICTIDSSTGEITIKGAGSCPVRVDVGATTYYRAHYAVATLVIAKAVQAPVTITSTNEVFYKQDSLMVNTPLLQPAATGGSGTGAFSFMVSGDCRLIAGKLITANAGSDCRLRAIRDGDANYEDALSAQQTILVKKVEQPSLAIGNLLNASVGDVDLFTTGGAGEGAITYTVDDAGTANCSIIDATKLRAAANGTCVIYATKATSTNFESKRTANKTFTFTKLAQSIAFTSTVPQSPVRGISYTPVAVATSGGSVSYTITTGNLTACEFDAIAAAATPSVAKINFLSSGTCTVTATQSGGSTYVSATATQRIEVGQINQTISFASLTEKTFGAPDFMVTATSNSGLAVAFSVGSATTKNACTVTSSGLISLDHEGLCEIAANQPGNSTYAAAPTVRQNFYVRADLAGKPKLTSISVGNQTFTATFTAPSYLGGADVLKYRLLLTQTDNGDQYSNSSCSTTAASGATFTCEVVGIPNGVAYTAQVAAITIAGIGNYSDGGGPLTPSANPMGVTQLTAKQTTTTNLRVNWEAPVVLDSQLVSYEVYVAPLGSTTFPATPTATTTDLNANITIASSPIATVSVSGGGFRTASVSAFAARRTLTPTYSATGYQVKVVTVTQNYDPITSATNDYQTVGQQIGLIAPSTPRSLTLTPVNSGLFISWAIPVSDGGSPIANYNVFANGVEIAGCQAINATSCDFATLAPYTDYIITVVANSDAELSSAAASATHDVEPAPAPPAPPAPTNPPVEPSPGPTNPPVTPSPGPTNPPVTPSPGPTNPPVEPSPGPTNPPVKPTPGPTNPPVKPPVPVTPEKPVTPETPISPPNAGPEPTPGPEPEAPAEPGEPVANPAIGASGDDSAPPAEFDPQGSPEAIAAAVDTAVNAAALAAAMAAAAAGAAAAAAAGAAGAAGAGGGSNGGGSSSSSSQSEAARRPDEFAEGEGSSESEGEPESLDVVQENLTIAKENWGDRLALFALPFITFLDRRSHNAAERTANISPFFAKLINDGAYLRAMLGTLSLLGPIAAAVIATLAVIENNAEIAAGEYTQIITPGWQWLLAIALLGTFDAAAGFVGAMVFIIGSVITVGHVPDSGEIRTMMGMMLISVGPALLATGFRTIRKQAAQNFNAWWERIADFVIAPFIAGWSVSAMVGGLPSLAGLTLDAANHVQDFAIFVTVATIVRVALEELAAAGFPARLNRINPDEIPDPSNIQKSIVLIIKYLVWVFIGGALIGPSWQVWIGSALFVFPTVIGWFSDRFPNSPRIWRLLPTGIPGLAFTILVASATAAAVGAILGDNPDLGKWSFVILPIPMLAITVLGWFGRHGEVDEDGNDEERPGKRNKWIYRIGGLIMLVITLKLAGVI